MYAKRATVIALIELLLVIGLSLNALTTPVFSEANIVEDTNVLANATLELITTSKNLRVSKVTILVIGGGEEANKTQRISEKPKPGLEEIASKEYMEASKIGNVSIRLVNIAYRLYTIAQEIGGENGERLAEIAEKVLAATGDAKTISAITSEVEELLSSPHQYPSQVLRLLNTLYTVLAGEKPGSYGPSAPEDHPYAASIGKNEGNSAGIMSGMGTTSNINTDMDKGVKERLIASVIDEIKPILRELERNNTLALALLAAKITEYPISKSAIAKYLALITLSKIMPLSRAYKLIELHGLGFTYDEIEFLKKIGVYELTGSEDYANILAVMRMLGTRYRSGSVNENRETSLFEILNALERRESRKQVAVQRAAMLTRELLVEKRDANTSRGGGVVIAPILLTLVLTTTALLLSLILSARYKRSASILIFKPSRLGSIGNNTKGERLEAVEKSIESTIIVLYWRASALLSRRVPRRPFQTHREYLASLRGRVSDKIVKSFEKLTFLYEQARYGHRRVSEKEAAHYLNTLEEELKGGK